MYEQGLLGERKVWMAGEGGEGPAAEVAGQHLEGDGKDRVGCGDFNTGSYPRHSRLLLEQFRQLGWPSSHCHSPVSKSGGSERFLGRSKRPLERFGIALCAGDKRETQRDQALISWLPSCHMAAFHFCPKAPSDPPWLISTLLRDDLP